MELQKFWDWAEGKSFQFGGQRYLVKVDRYQATYPYPHSVEKHYADPGRKYGWVLALDNLESAALTHLFTRYARGSGR